MSRHDRIAELFLAAAKLPASKRASFLDQECAGDDSLRGEVEDLLQHDQPDSFLEEVVVAPELSTTLQNSDEATSHTGPDHIGAYKILDVLGEGGMGTVYLAEQKEPVRRRVALKLIKRGMDTKKVLARFEAERQALALMDHDHIAKVLDAGQSPDGRPFFAMEYIRGIPITEYCTQNRLDIDSRLRLFQQVCTGVQHAHQKGVIHRDLKPGNVLVTAQADEPRVKIIDFGVARATDQRLVDQTALTELGQFIGTPEFMSPEQAGLDELDLDTRSDIYSLGVLLYVLLTDQLPFAESELRRHGLLEIQRTIREVEPPRPSTRCTDAGEDTTSVAHRRQLSSNALVRRLRGDLDWITMKALEKDRKRRYQTALELAEDLRRHLTHEPVTAGPPSSFYRLRKLVRKHRKQAGAATVVMVALVAVFVSSLTFYLRKEEQRKEAEGNATIAENMATEAKRQAAIVQRENHNFRRLSVRVQLEDANREQQALFPSWPENVRALEEWMKRRGRPLEAEVLLVRQTFRDLSTRGRPLTVGEIEQMYGPERVKTFRALQKKVTSIERAAAVRSGKVPPAPATMPTDAPKDAHEMSAMVIALVNVTRRPEMYGREAEALAMAQHALRTSTQENRWAEFMLLAIALAANGMDTAAMDASAAALQAAPPHMKELVKDRRARLRNNIALADWALGYARSQLRNAQGARFGRVVDEWLFIAMCQVELQLYGFTEWSGILRNVRLRLSWAKRIDALTTDHPNARTTWEAARTAIQKADGISASRLYAARPIDLKPQMGLVPIGMNPVTKLWEFYHLRSAWNPVIGSDPATIQIPQHRPDGSIEVEPATGVVFVLIPGGAFHMGAQKTDTDAANYDPFASPDEKPRLVEVNPFFLARHELTQGQWTRLDYRGPNPSRYGPGTRIKDGAVIGPRHPVEHVDWNMCSSLMNRFGLDLPSPEEWEYACRGGTDTVWFPGDDPSSLRGYANLAGTEANPAWTKQRLPFSDGHRVHAPVGSFLANAFGMFDMHGNVREWCGGSSSGTTRELRGGSYTSAAIDARCAKRSAHTITRRIYIAGMRASRPLH